MPILASQCDTPKLLFPQVIPGLEPQSLKIQVGNGSLKHSRERYPQEIG